MKCAETKLSPVPQVGLPVSVGRAAHRALQTPFTLVELQGGVSCDRGQALRFVTLALESPRPAIDEPVAQREAREVGEDQDDAKRREGDRRREGQQYREREGRHEKEQQQTPTAREAVTRA